MVTVDIRSRSNGCSQKIPRSLPRSGSFVPIRHSRYYTTLLTPKMYLRNTHLVSFTKVEGLSVPYIVDVYEFLAREP